MSRSKKKNRNPRKFPGKAEFIYIKILEIIDRSISVFETREIIRQETIRITVGGKDISVIGIGSYFNSKGFLGMFSYGNGGIHFRNH